MKKKFFIYSGIFLVVVIAIVFLFVFSGEEETPMDEENGEMDAGISGEENGLTEDREEAEREVRETDNDDRLREEEVIREEDGITYSERDGQIFVYEGEGSKDFGIRRPEEGSFLLYIEGNREEGHFTVTGVHALPTYYGGKSTTHLFVNTSVEYEGTVLDWEGRTNELRIQAEGPWRVEVRPLSMAKKIEANEKIEARGDSVLLLEDEVGEVSVKGGLGEERGGDHFQLVAYNKSREVIAEESGEYEEVLEIPDDTEILQVLSCREWEIEAR